MMVVGMLVIVIYTLKKTSNSGIYYDGDLKPLLIKNQLNNRWKKKRK